MNLKSLKETQTASLASFLASQVTCLKWAKEP